LTGPINFIARSEGLRIVWDGDRTGPTLPPDLVMLQVKDSRQITPRVRRITLIGGDLDRLDVDDQMHCRLMFQPIGVRQPQWPMLGDNGDVVWPGGDGRLASRIYTIRKIDEGLRELEIDFFLHDRPGPATQWALQASVHDIVGALGPAAHGPRPASWFVLAGDETGLPGIGRILEGLPRTSRGVAFIEVSDETERQAIQAPAGVEVHWLYRNGAFPGTTTLLSDAVQRTAWPVPLNQTFFWGGYELGAFRAIRRYLKDVVGLPKSSQVSHPHWRRGMSEDDIIEVGGSAISE
jgi:NADPH-dependent ferric siderophore reductase